MAGLVTATLSLTGCVTIQLKASVHSDNTVSGTARIGVAKSLATVAGGSPADLVAQLKSQNPCDFGGKAGATKDFDDGTFVGLDCSFSGLTLDQFNSGGDGPRLVRSGDTFQLSGRLDLTSLLSSSVGGLLGSTGPGATADPLPTDLSSLLPSGFPTDLSSLLPSGLSSLLPSGFPTDLSSLLPSGLPTDLTSLLPSGSSGLGGLGGLDPSTLLKSAKISFAFTFPGKVTASAQGRRSGNTVTFAPDAAGRINFQTTASAKPAGGLAGLSSSSRTGGIGLVVLLALLLLGIVLIARRRRSRAAAVAGGVGPAGAGYADATFGAGYPNPHYQGQYPAQQYQPEQYPSQPYPSQPYPTQPNPNQPYPGQPYPGQPYPSQQNPNQPYSNQPYPNQPYPSQPYPSPPNPTQPYPEQLPDQYPDQPYAGPPPSYGSGPSASPYPPPAPEDPPDGWPPRS